MKRYNLLLIFCLFLTGILSSCYEDQGNYDYDWVPEVTLNKGTGGFRDTTIMRGQRLTVVPDLKMLLTSKDETSQDTVAFRPEEFSYKWTAYLHSISTEPTVLAVTQNLDTIINLPLQSEVYRIVYSVTEKASEVTWNFSFNLRVEARYSNAWLFLTEDDDRQVDLVLYGNELGNQSENPWVFEENILERSGFPYRGKGAKFIYYASNESRIYVGTGESAGWIGKNDLQWNDKQLLRFQMASATAVDYTFENIIKTSCWHYIATDGNIYPRGNTDVVMSAYNILPPSMNVSGKYETVKLAPFIGGGPTSGRVLVFDETNNRMLVYSGSGGNPALNAQSLSGNNRLLNHKLYYMSYYVPDYAYVLVIAKDLGNNKYYKYIYYNNELVTKETTEIINGSLLDVTDGTLDRTKQYVCDYNKGNFYMAHGNKLYVLKENTLQEVTVLDPDNKLGSSFNGFDPICLLTRYTEISSTRSYIMIATYVTGTEDSGKIYYLEPNSTAPWELTIKTYYENMDRVKGISRF